jgi:S-adenosylmethionine decarboxylase proenzyme
MFNERLSSGKHMICDIRGIENNELLNNCLDLKKMLNSICDKYNFQILQEVNYEFTPQGCSILFLLSESHISIHTFPERKHMSLDLYTCREYENDEEYKKIYDFLLETLSASKDSTLQIVERFF